MKRETKKIIKRKTLLAAETLFSMAKELGLFMEEIIFTPYGQLRQVKIPRATYNYRIRNFEKNGLIKKVRKSYGVAYELTSRAKEIRRLPRKKIERHDGLSSVVMFDVPEQKHKSRDCLRRYLLKQGFVQIQKSVFISPFQVSKEFLEFIQEIDLAANVTILSAKVDHLLKP
jgi:hypothetical protein